MLPHEIKISIGFLGYSRRYIPRFKKVASLASTLSDIDASWQGLGCKCYYEQNGEQKKLQLSALQQTLLCLFKLKIPSKH